MLSLFVSCNILMRDGACVSFWLVHLSLHLYQYIMEGSQSLPQMSHQVAKPEEVSQLEVHTL